MQNIPHYLPPQALDFDGTSRMPEPSAQNGAHTVPHPGVSASQPGQKHVSGQPSLDHGGAPQCEVPSNGSPKASTAGAPLSKSPGDCDPEPWSNTDRNLAHLQALLSECSQTHSAKPRANAAAPTSRDGAAPHRNHPTSQHAAPPNNQPTIHPRMPSTSSEIDTYPQPVQPLAASQRGTAKPATGHWVPEQASAGAHDPLHPEPAPPGPPPAAQCPSRSSSSASSSSSGWEPNLQLARESSSRLQAAFGLVDVAVPAPGAGATAAAKSHAGGNTTAALNRPGQPAQQKQGGHHAVASQNQNGYQDGYRVAIGGGGQQGHGRGGDSLPWFD